MLITTIKELRLCFPTHAIDHIEPYVGYIDNSEHEFLLNPLGQPLYDKLCDWYDEHKEDYSQTDGKDVGYYNRLLLMAQRCVAFDAMGRSYDMQAVSVNNAGLNFATAEDYPKADRDAKNDAKNACSREAHSALNRLLYTLEQWTAIAPTAEDSVPAGLPGGDYELFEIVKFWRSSRYFYLAAQLLIPSATVLQEYLNIYDSREKFIQMLPDLHFIQEEQIAPSIGEDFCEYLVNAQLLGGTKRDATAAMASTPLSLSDDADIPPTMRRLLHKLRKIEATLLEGRTKVIKVDKDRRIAAHDEGIRLLGLFTDYCQQHQSAILKALDQQAGYPPTAAAMLSPQDQETIATDVLQGCLEAEAPFTESPLFVAPDFPTEATTPAESSAGNCTCCTDNRSSMSMLVTPPLL